MIDREWIEKVAERLERDGIAEILRKMKKE